MSQKLIRYAIGVEYQGTNYCGWQRQKECASVQQWVEEALSDIANEPIQINCAGRTDTAVHGVGQVAHFETHNARPDRAWTEGVNTKLPGDIRVVWVKQMSGDFHARFSAVARQYRYVIFNRRVHSAVLAKRVTWEKDALAVESMQSAAKALLGQHDFSSFRASGCQANSPVRTIEFLNVSRVGKFVFIDIKANAFLHHMVRNIAGTLLEVGRGEKPADWVAELLAKKDRTQAGMTAPADGLYFVNAFYPVEFNMPVVQVDEILWQLQ